MDRSVVAVYEVYQDLGPLRTLRLVVWAVPAVAFSLIPAMVGHALGAKHTPPSPNALPILELPGADRLSRRELEKSCASRQGATRTARRRRRWWSARKPAPERLAARPQASLCIDCKLKEERHSLASPR